MKYLILIPVLFIARFVFVLHIFDKHGHQKWESASRYYLSFFQLLTNNVSAFKWSCKRRRFRVFYFINFENNQEREEKWQRSPHVLKSKTIDSNPKGENRFKCLARTVAIRLGLIGKWAKVIAGLFARLANVIQPVAGVGTIRPLNG